jgi:hypothetical protein
MAVSLESLDLTPEQLELAREMVRKWAYIKWEEAGRPISDGEPFWGEAEREWIERCYVPPRLPEAVVVTPPVSARAQRPTRETVGA